MLTYPNSPTIPIKYQRSKTLFTEWIELNTFGSPKDPKRGYPT